MTLSLQEQLEGDLVSQTRVLHRLVVTFICIYDCAEGALVPLADHGCVSSKLHSSFRLEKGVSALICGRAAEQLSQALAVAALEQARAYKWPARRWQS